MRHHPPPPTRRSTRPPARTAPQTSPQTSTRTTVPPPLPEVDLTVPDWPVVTRARRRLDVVRSATGRLATVAGAGAAATGLLTSNLTGVSLAADAALTLTGLATLRLWKPDGQQKATATALYLLPGTGLAAVLAGEYLVPGIHWGEALALAAWASATWVLRPARLARRMLTPPPAPLPAPAEPGPELEAHPVARWWAERVAIDGGAAPGTLLRDIHRIGDSALRAVICTAAAGEPVPEVAVRRLSALMDVPEEQISIGPVPGRGASVRQLTVGVVDEAAVDPATVWARRIAPAAAPGSVLTGVRVGRPGHPPAQTQTTPMETTPMETTPMASEETGE